MLKSLIALIALLPSLAAAQVAVPSESSYLVLPTAAAASARSNQQWLALCKSPCNPDDVTQTWWSVQPLTDGTAAVVVEPSGAFAATTTNANVLSPVGLTSTEQAALETRAQLGTLLPDVLSTAAFLARFTADQSTAISGSAYASELTAIQAAAFVDLEDVAVDTWLNDIVSAGLVPASQLDAITTPTPIPGTAQ